MSVGGLADHPVGVAAEGPAGNGADQGLLVAQTLDEVGDELGQVRYHALHTAWKDNKVLHILKREKCNILGNIRACSSWKQWENLLCLTLSDSPQH